MQTRHGGIRVVFLLAGTLLVVSGCFTVAPPRNLAFAGSPCRTARADVLSTLRGLDRGRAGGDLLAPHASAMNRMLAACDAEARSVPGEFAEDWRTQRSFLRSDLRQMLTMNTEELQRFLPLHRLRMSRLLRTYEELFDDPGRLRGSAVPQEALTVLRHPSS